MKHEDIEIERGSGNVFSDLGLPHADTELIKARLAAELLRVMREQELTAVAVGQKVGIAPADISRIRNADLGRFSIDRLVRILNGLEQKVEISVSPIRAEAESAA